MRGISKKIKQLIRGNNRSNMFEKIHDILEEFKGKRSIGMALTLTTMTEQTRRTAKRPEIFVTMLTMILKTIDEQDRHIPLQSAHSKKSKSTDSKVIKAEDLKRSQEEQQQCT